VTELTENELSTVAARAGVERSVAADVLAGRGRYSAHEAALVRRALATIAYRPAIASRFARRSRTGLIALAVPDLGEPYFAELVSLTVRLAGQRGLSVSVHQTDSEWSNEVAVISGVVLPPVDGLIHVQRSLTLHDLTRRVDASPLVIIGPQEPNNPFNSVTFDNQAMAHDAVAHLIACGYRSIAHLGPRPSVSSEASQQRHDGYVDALQEAGRPVTNDLVLHVPAYIEEAGQSTVSRLLQGELFCDAVFCSNDALAVGALLAAHEAGVRVPDDFGIVGINDIPAAAFTWPTLTTIAPDKQALISTALDLLQAQIDAPPTADPPVKHVVVPHRLIVRGTTRLHN